MRLFVHGRVQAKRRRGAVTIEMNVTNHRVLADDVEWKGNIVPVYPATKDVPTRTLRSIIAKNLSKLLEDVEELLPPEIVQAHRLTSARTAWRTEAIPEH
jgi:RecG-like helicase